MSDELTEMGLQGGEQDSELLVTSARWLLSDGNGPCAYDGCENDADLLVGVEKGGAAATIRLCERCDQANHIHAADVAGDAP